MTHHEAELLEDLRALVAADRLQAEANRFMADVGRLEAEYRTTGAMGVPIDPFRGRRDSDAPLDPNLYYTMFWRMFDRTPAAMMQGFAIEVRRILAKRIFRHCGEGVTIHHNVLFSRGDHISVGDGSLLNRYVMLDDRAEIDIGSFVMVSAGVTIETHTHPFDDFSVPIAQGGRDGRPVKIGSNTVLGYNAVVMAGTTIGYRCIVGANSVVTKDVPDYTVVGGVPAKPIKQYLPPGSGPVWIPPEESGT